MMTATSFPSPAWASALRAIGGPRLHAVLVALVLCLAGAPATAQEEGNALSGSQDPADFSADVGATWKGALADSFRLLAMEHFGRVAFQAKTRRELGGNFFADYHRSLKWPRTWEDGDGWLVNYVGHPIHGAAAGYIWLDHEDGSHDPRLGFSSEYWASRGRATAWAASYSLQFEFGLLSEASIGNVGMHPGTTGWVDHVVTPIGALGFIVAEDALDRHLVTRMESWTGSRFVRALVRVAFNPSRSLSNVAQGRVPWFRAGRSLRREAGAGGARRRIDVVSLEPDRGTILTP